MQKKLTTNEEARVLDLVRSAFRDVKLGEGVGLWQAEGLDDYADVETLERYRAADEKEDWSAIPAETLDRCYSSLSFFDAEGMRFHLPAYSCAELEGRLSTADVLFHLTWFENRNRPFSRYEALTASQRDTVRAFLLLRASDPEYAFHHPLIELALREFWAVPPGAGR